MRKNNTCGTCEFFIEEDKGSPYCVLKDLYTFVDFREDACKDYQKKEKVYIMHLFLLKKCLHNCDMCCNKLYDIGKIKVATVDELKTVDTVCFTGGEPFLIDGLNNIALKLKKQYPNIKNIYTYTSGLQLLKYIEKQSANCLHGIDGVTISPKNKSEWDAVKVLLTNDKYNSILKGLKSNRLYVFREDIKTYEDIKDIVNNTNLEVIDRKWDKAAKTHKNEIFRRLQILLDN